MKVLVTGGAGYIGSTVSNYFIDRGHEVTIIDNLSTGSIKNLPKMVPKSIRIGPKSCLGGVLGHLGPKMAPRALKRLKNESFDPLLGGTLGPKINQNRSQERSEG